MNPLPLDLVNYIGKYSYLIFIFVLLQGSLLIILFYFFADKFSNTRSKKIQDRLLKEEAYQKAIATLEDAKKSSIELIREANTKAQQMINDVEILNSKSSAGLDLKIKELADRHIKSLDDTTSSFITDYKTALKTESVKSTEELEKTTTIVKEALLSEVGQFKDIIRKETYEAEQEVQNKIKNDYSVMRDEIEKYKKDKIERINSTIYEIIANVAKNTTGIVLDLDSHQKIIKDYLDQAFKEKQI